MEPTGPKVPSRYLTGPTGSCHDHCKCASTKQTTETKPINPIPKRVPKAPADKTHTDAPNSVPKITKSSSVIPKTGTRAIKNNNVVKEQTLKKDVVIEPKKRDFKLKSVNSHVKTYNQTSLRTPRRRLSDVVVPDKDMSLQSSRFPKRRLSEVIIHQNTDIASVSNGLTGRGSGVNKNESRKDSKLPLVNKKSTSVKTTVSTTKRNAKVSPLKTNKSLPRPEVKGSRKSKPVKPVEEIVHEETNVNEPNNDVEITTSQSQSQNQKLLDCSPSSSEVKDMKDDQNEVVESSPPSMEDVTLEKDGQSSSFEVKDMKDDQHEVVESSPPSMEDVTLEKDGQSSSSEVKDVKDDQNEVVEESSPPSMEEDTLAKDDQSLISEGEDDQNEVVESSPPSMEDDNLAKDDQSSNFEVKDDQNEVVESSSSVEDDTLAKDDQQNDNISDSEVDDTKVTTRVAETNDFSLDDLTFRRGTILSPESVNNSLIELQFVKGKELEIEIENGETVSLRRLSSDGVVCIPESVSISIDLKHQETEEKKAAVLINNVIEEAASKLIQTRKSKVKALVGAFETIVSGETPRSSTSGST